MRLFRYLSLLLVRYTIICSKLLDITKILQVLLAIVLANKHKFRKRARATAKVITMSKIFSPKKKHSSKAKVSHKKQRRRSTIIVEDYDSKKITDITDLVCDPPDNLEGEDIA